MNGLNTDSAIEQLDRSITITSMRNCTRGGAAVITARNHTAAPEAEGAEQAQLVETIFDRVIPTWRTDNENLKNNRWTCHREAAIRAREEVVRAEEIRRSLGDDAPEISAALLNPWIWRIARSLWQSGPLVHAPRDSADKLNAETQNRVGRRHVSETYLCKQSYSLSKAKPRRSCLRRILPEDRNSYRSRERGEMAFAEVVCAGIRIPLSDEADQELSEQVALEYLAALSVLVRWEDESQMNHKWSTQGARNEHSRTDRKEDTGSRREVVRRAA